MPELELKVKYDRELSYGVLHPNDERRLIWLPKSQVELLSALHELPKGLTAFDVPQWICERNGLR